MGLAFTRPLHRPIDMCNLQSIPLHVYCTLEMVVDNNLYP